MLFGNQEFTGKSWQVIRFREVLDVHAYEGLRVRTLTKSGTGLRVKIPWVCLVPWCTRGGRRRRREHWL
jgi:hypothetical protein